MVVVLCVNRPGQGRVHHAQLPGRADPPAADTLGRGRSNSAAIYRRPEVTAA
jgi:hypothetical protein